MSFAQGLTPRLVTGEAIREAIRDHLLRAAASVCDQRAKHWITSPDPAYARKKGAATA